MKNNPYQKDIDLIINNIEEFIDVCDNTKKAYFWNPPSTANQRRKYNKTHNYDLNEEFNVFHYKYHKTYTYPIHLVGNLHLSCSYKNIYRSCFILLNEQPINLTVLKHLFAILKEEKYLTSQFIKRYHLQPSFYSKEDICHLDSNS